jgi:acyl-CoA dehydrogenase
VDFDPSDRCKQLQERLLAFMDEVIYPNEAVYESQLAGTGDPHGEPPVMEELKARAREQGLWNLFLPHATEWTDGVSNIDYAPLAEITGRSPIAPEAINCNAPDTGNMELLALFGTQAQKEQWLQPLLEGEIRSCFAMTEPDVASSDATNISLRIERDGDDYVLNGRKWWITGAGRDRCRVSIVMGKTDPRAAPHRQQSMVLVPMDAPGLTNVRSLPVFGYVDQEGHCELVFDDVRVPAENLLGEEGGGFAMAQARLGPGRIHHCMRTIGVAERALELMCRRVQDRVAWHRPLAEQGVIREWIAESRIDIEQARLLTLKTAWLIDHHGAKGAFTEIAAIKVAVPNMALRVIDRAIQAHGGGGVSNDFPLARMYAGVRTLRLADGPDEVHRRTIAKRELGRHGQRPETGTEDVPRR